MSMDLCQLRNRTHIIIMSSQEPKDTSGTKSMAPIIRKSVESGLITKGSISETNRPNTSVEESINFDFDTIGSARLRLGTTPLGPQLPFTASTDVSMVYGTQYGKWNQGAGFTVTQSSIDFGSYKIPTTNSFSYSLWFKSTSNATDACLISFSGYFVLELNSGKIKFIGNGGNIISGNNYNDGNWHHVVATFNDGNAYLFVDGIVVANGSIGTYSLTTADLVMGAIGSSGGNQFIGSIDDFAIFLRQITFLDVLALYGSELANTYLISDGALLGYWQFEGSSTISIVPILGMHYFVDTINNGLNTQLIVVVGTTVSIWADGITFSTWFSGSIRGSLTPGAKARFSTFLNFVFMVNGADSTAVWDGLEGDSFVTSGNAASAPIGKFIENFKNRMWIAGNTTYPDRVYYTSIPSSVSTPILLWNTDVSTGQWIDINPLDGNPITGMQRWRGELLIFKTNYLYRLFDINQVDPAPLYPVGTSSQESIVETKAGLFFHHSSGFYMYNPYDMLQEISQPIIDIVKAIPSSSYGAITGWLEPDGDHICWSVGSVTVNPANQTAGTTGIFYKNLVVRYTISTQTWTHRSYPTQIVASLRRQPLFNDGNNKYALVGDTSGAILKPNTGNVDSTYVNSVLVTTPIYFSLIHAWETLDGLLSTRKSVMVANFSHYGGTGAIVAYQTEDQDPDALTDWTKKVGQLKEKNTGFNTMNIKSRKIRFRIFGESIGQPFFYSGYELIDVINEFLQFPNN